MDKHLWSKNFPAAIIVTDENGIIIEMNNVSIENYRKDGGAGLIGKNLFDCHKEPTLSKVKDLYKTQSLNVYTVTKNGKKKMIYQAPYFVNGKFSGMVEISLPLPDDMPHYDRDKK